MGCQSRMSLSERALAAVSRPPAHVVHVVWLNECRTEGVEEGCRSRTSLSERGLAMSPTACEREACQSHVRQHTLRMPCGECGCV